MKRVILSLVIAIVGTLSMNAQTCNRCGDEGIIREGCQVCNGNGTISCFNCGSTGVKVWRCPECIAAGRI